MCRTYGMDSQILFYRALLQKRPIRMFLCAGHMEWTLKFTCGGFFWQPRQLYELPRFRGAVRMALRWDTIYICDMTHSYVWRGSFICVTWLFYMCDVTRSYVWRDSFICVIWQIHSFVESWMWHQWMIHVTHNNESCHTQSGCPTRCDTYDWVSHVTHVNSESCHTQSECPTKKWHMWINELCHTCEQWVMSHSKRVSYKMWHIWLSELCHTCEQWVMSHSNWVSYKMWHMWMNELCHAYDTHMSHIWMIYVTHMNESCHT